MIIVDAFIVQHGVVIENLPQKLLVNKAERLSDQVFLVGEETVDICHIYLAGCANCVCGGILQAESRHRINRSLN